MGRFSAWSYTSRLTIWPVTFDAFGQPVTGTPYHVNGTFQTGGTAARDDDNIEFIPNATFWFELDAGQPVPQRQWYIVVGEHDNDRPASAEPIRVVQTYDISQFEAGSLPDYKVLI